MKNIVIFLLIIFAFFAGYLFSQKYNFKLEPKNSTISIVPTLTPVPLVGADSDSHGCKASAGYSWCEIKQRCLRNWEEPCESVSVTPTINEDDVLKTTIKQQLVVEHGQTANNLTITVSKTDGDFVRGMASESGGGGIWLAKKISGSWKLVFDGNGVPDCLKLKTTYLFPATILSGVCD